MPTIRAAQLDDLVWLRQLYEAIHTENRLPYPNYLTKESLEAFTASIAARLARQEPTFGCFVAEEGPRLVGFVLGEIMVRPIGAPHRYAICHYIYTAPDYRNQGVGRALSAAALAYCQQMGAEAVEIASAPGDMQWVNRGWVPVAMTCALSLAGFHATLVQRSEHPNGHGKDTADAGA